MPFFMVRDDITRMDVDAVVNAANNELVEGGGVCGSIFNAAGADKLAAECERIGFCETGKAVITSGYRLRAKYIIHTPGPVWNGGNSNEGALLAACYRNSLELAHKNGLKSIAFPLISSGIYGFPRESSLEIATEVIKKFLEEKEMTVYLVLYDNKSFRVGQKAYPGIREYITERYIPKNSDRFDHIEMKSETCHYKESKNCINIPKPFKERKSRSEESLFLKLMETFQEMLFRKIDELDLLDPDVYKRANLDRKLFSKIRNNRDYSPGKDTAIALGIALELDYVEIQEFLGKAGYTLSRSILSDVVIEFCIEKNIYNIHKINQILLEETGKCLGY